MRILDEVAKEIRPSKNDEQKTTVVIGKVLSRLNKNLSKIKAKAILGGSGAKQTWLVAFDVDIFVKFDYRLYKGKDISVILEKELKKIFSRIAKIPGSRDYFQVKEEGYSFEIIPILDIKNVEYAENITDVSPFHANWVVKNLSKKQKDEVRLLKNFCKANNLYGAESHIKGFSGYACEILVKQYGTFLGVLRASRKWKEQEVIDVEKHYKKKQDVFFQMNKSKLQSPLIIVDPVQKDRNASAALSYEKFLHFKEMANDFLNKPSKSFFEKNEESMQDLTKKWKGKHLIFLKAKSKAGKRDIVGCKIMKLYEFVLQKLEKNEFKVYGSGWMWDEKSDALFWYALDSKNLSQYVEWKGPPLKLANHVAVFKKKYKAIYVKKDHAYAKIKRKYTRPENLVSALLKEKDIRDKVNDVVVVQQ